MNHFHIKTNLKGCPKYINLSIFLILALLIGFSVIGCSASKVDLQKELADLAALQKQEQTAHLEEQPALLVNMLHDTLTQVKNGVVSYYTKDQMTERFISYFESVEFIKWEDASPPVYTLSEDGSMAHILIQKHVVVDIEQDTTGTRETTNFAWTEMWKKKEGRWKLYSVTTTDRESVRE
jgi:hypothetical protein